MKDKLIKIISEYMNLESVFVGATEKFADYLIANNVFVFPEKLNDSWEICGGFITRMFVADEAELGKIKREFECKKVKQIITDIYNYLVAIIDEWHRRSDEPNFIENNIMVYNHIRKEIDDLIEYAEKLGVEL